MLFVYGHEPLEQLLTFSARDALEGCEVPPIVGNSWGRGVVFVNWDDALKEFFCIGKRSLFVSDGGHDGDKHFMDAFIRAIIMKGNCELIGESEGLDFK